MNKETQTKKTQTFLEDKSGGATIICRRKTNFILKKLFAALEHADVQLLVTLVHLAVECAGRKEYKVKRIVQVGEFPKELMEIEVGQIGN